MTIVKKILTLVKAIYTSEDKNYSPIKLCGVVHFSDSEINGIIEELPAVIEYYTPYFTDKKFPITLKFALGKMLLLTLLLAW